MVPISKAEIGATAVCLVSANRTVAQTKVNYKKSVLLQTGFMHQKLDQHPENVSPSFITEIHVNGEKEERER